jgi:FtsH-binding integral membrane protein
MIHPAHMTPHVQEHIKRVMGHLSVYVFSFVVSILVGSFIDPSWWFAMVMISFFGSLMFCIATIVIPTNKFIFSMGVPICMGFTIIPEIYMLALFDPHIIAYAGFGTVIIFGTVYLYALQASPGYYAYLNSTLYTCLTSLIYVSIFGILFSDLLLTIELYAGLVLFCFYVTYDVNMMVTRAYDRSVYTGTTHINESAVIVDALNLFLDAVNIFVRLLRVFYKLFKEKK